jgi:hypothetical protein
MLYALATGNQASGNDWDNSPSLFDDFPGNKKTPFLLGVSQPASFDY